VKIKFGLYGNNGHQIQNLLVSKSDVEFYAVAGIPADKIPPDVKPLIYSSLDEMLRDPDIQIISLCSPLRFSQAKDAIKCMKAGKHVYAEKPSAMTEDELDEIIIVSKKTGMIYHEMAGTAFASPYKAIKRIIASGKLGTIIQIFSQKSYPWGEWRPKDEKIDGGLTMQVGIYNCRFIEHVVGIKIKSIQLKETKLCNHGENSECRRAASFLFELENGAIASAIANYCCPLPEDWGKWGYEILRIFGSNGFLECINNGEIAKIAISGEGVKKIDVSDDGDYLDMFIEEIKSKKKVIPLLLEEELSPTRWVIRAKNQL